MCSLYSRTIDNIFHDINSSIYETERMERIYNQHEKLFQKKYEEYKLENNKFTRGYNSFIYHLFRAYITLDSERDNILFEIYMRMRAVEFDITRMDPPHMEFFNQLRSRLISDNIVDICLKKTYQQSGKCYECDRYRCNCEVC